MRKEWFPPVPVPAPVPLLSKRRRRKLPPAQGISRRFLKPSSNLGPYALPGGGSPFQEPGAVIVVDHECQAAHLAADANRYLIASKAGSSDAQFNLGMCHLTGRGVDKIDRQEAKR